MPSGRSFLEAATIPVAFATVEHARFALAGLAAGERILVHAATGGVGLAALQLARRAGADVFATASPDKWPVLRRAGIPEDRIASSRSLDFADRFSRASGGAGIDVVLDSLAGPFVDASLGLLRPGGRFVELGRTDLRDPSLVALEHRGVRYIEFDLSRFEPDRVQPILARVVGRLERGEIAPLPFEAYDLRHAPRAFRFMAGARHVGKLVLVPPRPLDPAGTVLVTGWTGGLGRSLVRHLVERHGVRHLLLLSRQGLRDTVAGRTAGDLRTLGAISVEVEACAAADDASLAAALAKVPPERPLTAVFHAAGVLDDALATSLHPDQVRRVFGPKVRGAWNLHERTRDLDLARFVLFSSAAGTVGSPGQANYAAANAFLDALAARRRKAGLPATSLAWGLWSTPESRMLAPLAGAERDRLARRGLLALSDDEGLRLLDLALERPEAVLVPMRLDPARLDPTVPLFERLARRTQAAPERKFDLGAKDPARRGRLAEWLKGEVARILRQPPTRITPDVALPQLGLDSLTGIELRNRLQSDLGLSLPATLVWRYPTIARLADHLLERLDGPPAETLPAQPAAPQPEGALSDLERELAEAARVLDEPRSS